MAGTLHLNHLNIKKRNFTVFCKNLMIIVCGRPKEKIGPRLNGNWKLIGSTMNAPQHRFI